MTLQNENGDTRFSKLWVSKTGLTAEHPKPEDRIASLDAEIIADEFMKIFGMDAP